MPRMAFEWPAFGRHLLSWRMQRRWRRYAREAQRPLHALLFLLPPVLLYEIMAWCGRHGRAAGPLAPSMLQGVLSWFGVAGVWVPPVTFAAALLVWQHLRRDRWRVQAWVLPWMLLESLVVALPVLVIAGLFPQLTIAGAGGVGAELIRALGGAVYEELVFRLLLISGLVWLLGALAEVRGTPALAIAVGLAALAFAICHFAPVGGEAFAWGVLWFKLAAGVYFGLLFVNRGLGIAAGGHAAYNIMLVLWRALIME